DRVGGDGRLAQQAAGVIVEGRRVPVVGRGQPVSLAVQDRVDHLRVLHAPNRKVWAGRHDGEIGIGFSAWPRPGERPGTGAYRQGVFPWGPYPGMLGWWLSGSGLRSGRAGRGSPARCSPPSPGRKAGPTPTRSTGGSGQSGRPRPRRTGRWSSPATGNAR